MFEVDIHININEVEQEQTRHMYSFFDLSVVPEFFRSVETIDFTPTELVEFFQDIDLVQGHSFVSYITISEF